MLKSIFRGIRARTINFTNIHTTPVVRIREIVVEKKGEKTTVIEAKYVPSPRTPYLIKTDSTSNKCFLCQLQLDIKYTDVLILCQFINSKGEILRKQEIGICEQQFRLIKNLIYMAQHAGLLPGPPREKKPYEKLNTYYDEKTINVRKRNPIFSNKLGHLTLGPIENLRVMPKKGVGKAF